MELEKLEQKIERFYRKYYFKKFLLYFFSGVTALALFLLCLFVLAYFIGFETGQRKFLFYLWVGGAITLFLVLSLPLLRLFNVFQRMEYDGLTRLLNVYLPNLEDRLINVMELKKAYSDKPDLLLQASLEQKSNQILPLPILSVPALAFPRKPFIYLVSVVSFLALLLLVSPTFFERGAMPILDYNREIAIVAPYNVTFLNSDFKVKRGEDFELRIKVSGDFLPNQLQVHFAGNEFFMQQKSKTEFVYSFKNVNATFDFYLSGYRYKSELLKLHALPVPAVLKLEANLNYPTYTQLDATTFSDKGDFQVPEGTKITWNVGVSNTDSLLFLIDSMQTIGAVSSNNITFEHQFLASSQYAFVPKNAFFTGDSAMQYSVKVIPDEFPAIEVKQIADSTQLGVYYFNGLLSDDYGFSTLQFHVEYDSASITRKLKYTLPLNKRLNQTEFFHIFDFKSVGTQGKNLKYYFSITDNDAIHHGKTSQSTTFNLLIPSEEEVDRLSAEQREAAVKGMDESLKLAQQLKEDIARLNQALKTEKLSNWDKKEMIQEIKNKQEQLQKMMSEQLKSEQELMNMKQSFGDEKSQELLDKQEEINKLSEQLLDDELKQMLDELQKMQNEGNEDKLQEMSEKLDMSMADLEKQLDRNLEMLKRFQVEEKLSGLQYEMDKLAKDQAKLAEKTADSKSLKKDEETKFQQEAQQKQQDISKKLDDIKQEYDKMMQENAGLKAPMALDSMKQEFNEAQKKQDSLEEKMGEEKPSKSSKDQKEAAEQLEKMAEQMQKMQDQLQSDSMEVNEDDMRQLMDNLVWYSLEQEKLMELLSQLSFKDPRYSNFTNRQKQLHDNFSLVNDSLYALASRTAKIKKPIFDQLRQISYQQKVIEDNFQDRKINEIMNAQQRITTAANELALLFDEVLNQMQNSPSGSGSGKPSKNKKKDKKKDEEAGQMPSLRQQQEQLKQQLKEMMDGMKSGKMGKKQVSKQLAQMLGKQQTIQSKLQQLMQKGKLTPQEQRILNEINQLSDDVQRDLMNKNISPELINRQQKILTRMLEAEKSMQERDKEKKREATENRVIYKKPEQMFAQPDYKKEAFPAIMHKQSIELKQYYKGVYNNYLKELEKNGN